MTGEEVTATPEEFARALLISQGVVAACNRLSQLSMFYQSFRDRGGIVPEGATFAVPFQQWAAQIEQVAAVARGIADAADDLDALGADA